LARGHLQSLVSLPPGAHGHGGVSRHRARRGGRGVLAAPARARERGDARHDAHGDPVPRHRLGAAAHCRARPRRERPRVPAGEARRHGGPLGAAAPRAGDPVRHPGRGGGDQPPRDRHSGDRQPRGGGRHGCRAARPQAVAARGSAAHDAGVLRVPRDGGPRGSHDPARTCGLGAAPAGDARALAALPARVRGHDACRVHRHPRGMDHGGSGAAALDGVRAHAHGGIHLARHGGRRGHESHGVRLHLPHRLCCRRLLHAAHRRAGAGHGRARAHDARARRVGGPAPGCAAGGDTLMESALPYIWAGLLVLAVFMYVLLDGFDLGLGILFPFAPEDEDRDVMMNSVAPVWDGNETWLVLGGGGLFAAFPKAYAALMPALYIPIILMLLALIFRGVAFEFRHQGRAAGRRWWTIAFAAGSIVAAIAQGLVLGGFIQGVRLGPDGGFAGGPFDWLTPFSLLVAVSLVAGYALLGAAWLVFKTQGELFERARRWV